MSFRAACSAKFIILALCWALLLSIQPVRAQTNPAVTACGLPAQGFVVATVTYTMTADCELTGTLQVQGDITMTINGGGFKITKGGTFVEGMINAIRAAGDTPRVVLNRVTLNANNQRSLNLFIDDLSADQVTFERASSTGWGGPLRSYSVWNLSNVYFRSNTGAASDSDGSVMSARRGGRLTLNNAAFLANWLGGGAVTVLEGGRVTISGCLSEIGNIPRFVKGSFGNSSTGECTGTVGNGHTLTITVAPPDACGMPVSGEVRRNAVYTLTATCTLTGHLYIKEGRQVTINGNGNEINGNFIILTGAGARLTINDVTFRGGPRIINYARLEGRLVTFTEGTNYAVQSRGGVVYFQKLRVKDYNVPRVYVLLAYNANRRGYVNMFIHNAIFDGVISNPSLATLFALGRVGRISLSGCVSFINNTVNTVAQTGGEIVDNSTGDCPTDADEFAGLPGRSFGASRPQQPKTSSGGESATPAGPQLQTCLTLPEHITVYNITHSTQCQQVDAGGVGNAEVLARGFRDGLDVWSWVLPGTQVCFAGSSGSFLFLDAATAPRAVSALPVERRDGKVCATIRGAGTVVWLDGPPAAPYAPLRDCMVQLDYALNFRATPSRNSAVLRTIPHHARLTAVERTNGWFKVDWHGEKGWVSADYVSPIGRC